MDLPEAEWPIIDLLDAADEEQTPGPRLHAFMTESAALLERLPGSAEAHFVRGYALFLASRRESALVPGALEEMVTAMRLRSGHHWARYNAIILSHELGDHSAVIAHFLGLDRDFFAEDGKDWRYLVAWEYAVDSWARLGQADRFAAELAGLVRAYQHYADSDEILHKPENLLRLLAELRAGGVETLTPAARDSCARLLAARLALLVPGSWIREDELRP
ncbi:hypothetical protein HII36_06650 [Nonomuraea sp. NN258]|uniref:hypothetical protein n=1 Tax=Nonomuraea antri TaxID=2730852 RepID=UPI00156A0A6E|nr:hypothetical protein [Nonomuraea antri]NRQ31521.1 hypothetical protein [Nonomuraea antri]